jgi:choline dehydrogenase
VKTAADALDGRQVDYLILGGGSAGCVLADRLSESGRHEVMLVEAGPPDRYPFIHVPAGFLRLIDHPRLSWRYRSEADAANADRVIAYPQGRMLGGTGSLNGMLYVRSGRAEHERWVAAGCTGWSFDEVLPLYARIENIAGAAPDHRVSVAPFLETHPLSTAFLEACGQAGCTVRDSLNGAEREGAAAFHQNRIGRFRGGAAQTYLRRARGRPNLTVVTGTLAERVLVDGARATGAALRHGARTLRVRARNEVIVACGTIRSPHLLQLSGIGPASLLEALGIRVVVDRPGVGANLRDHYSVRVTERVRGIGTLNERTRGFALARELVRYARGRGLLTLGASTCAAFLRSDDAQPAPDLQLSFAPGSFEPGTYSLEREPGMTIALYHSYPESAGSVRARSADIADAPAIRPAYLAAPGDRAATTAGLRAARRILGMPALRKWSVGETLPGANVQSDADLLAYFRAKGVSGYHLVGTCRMGGDGDEDAVVDPQLRVRGVAALRVVDASILPGCTSGNSNAPTMMVAEKGAAMILADAEVASGA